MKTHLKHSSLTASGKVQPCATLASFGYMLWLLVLLLGSGAFEVKAATFTSCATVTGIPATECDVLKTLYDNTGGATWTDHATNNWLATDTPCSWGGITCSTGKVISINLSQNNLIGTLPDLSALTNLTSLDLSENQLNSTIPNFNLPLLQTLFLNANQLSGTIPNFNLPALQWLFLDSNRLSGPLPSFNLLSNLQVLGLSYNKLSGPIPNNLPNLETLDISVNQLSGTIPNFNLPKLQNLYLYSNQLTGSLPTFTLPALQGLYLSSNQFTGAIPNLSISSPNIKKFYADNNQLSGDIPVWITNTSSLNLDDNYLTASNLQVKQFLDTNYPGWQTKQNSVAYFTSTPITTAAVWTFYTYSITATDMTGSPLTITSLQPLPAWLKLTDNRNGTATLTGTPTKNDTNTTPAITLRVQNANGVSQDQSFNIQVMTPTLYTLTLQLDRNTLFKNDPANNFVVVTGTLSSLLPTIQTQIANREVTLTITPSNNQPSPTTRTDNTGNFTVTVKDPFTQIGKYTLQAVANDTFSPSQTLTVEEITGTTLSEITIPQDQAQIDQPLLKITGKATDTQQGMGIKQVELTLLDKDTQQYLSLTSKNTSATPVWIPAQGKTDWSVNTDQVTWVPGHNYLITARAVDLAGVAGAEKTAVFTILVPPSTLTLTPSKTSLLVTQESTVEVTARLSNPSQPTADLSNLTITLTAPDTTVTPKNVSTQIGGEVKFTWSGLTQVGTYKLTASFDGNSQLKPAQATVTIEVVPVVKGEFGIYQPLDKSTLNSLSIPLIYGQATDPNVKQVKVAIQNQTSHNYLKIENLVGQFVKDETWILAEGTSFWRLDVSNAKFINKKTYLIRARAFDASNKQIGEEATATFKIDSLQPFTTLYLELNSATILNGDQVNLTGKLNVFPDNGQNLANLPIELTILSPKQEQTTLLIDTHTTTGQFQLSNFSAFKQPGQYIFTASFAGTDELSPSISKPQYLLVGESAGYAILIQGKIANGEGQAAHNKTVNRIYEKLKERGFEDDNIRYFSYDLKQKGVDAIPNKADIEKAFTDLQARINGSPAPFYVIMVDHGSADSRFHIDYKGNNDTIEAAQLNTWLTNLESGLKPEALQKPRLVILGACYSGSFIPTLSKSGRIIITSAAENEVSYKGPVEPGDGVRSGELFMEEFFQALGQGDAFTKAFEEGADKIRIFTRQGDAKNKKDNKVTTSTGAVKKRFDDGALQHPLLDDNGDGQGSNVLTLNGDGLQVASFYLGTGPNYDTNFAGNPVDILDVTPTRYLTSQESSQDLLMWVNGARRVAAAVVDIRPPTVTLLVDGREHTEQVEIKNLPREFLSCNEQQQRCSTTTHQFDKPGKYEVFYFARDAETTNISPLHYSVVYKDYDGNQPPLPVTLKAPEKGITPPTTLVFDWDKTTDPNGELVTYTLLIAQDEAFNHIVYRQEELRLSMTYVDSRTKVRFWKDNTYEEQDGLKDQTTYYWKVVAVDSFGAHTDSEVRPFTTDNPNAPPGCSHLTVNDSITGELITDVNIVAPTQETPPPIYPEDGNYFICLPSVVESSYELHVGSDGYEEVVIWLDVVPNTRSLHHLRSASSSTFLTNKEIQNMPKLQVLLTPKQKPTLPGTIQFEADESSANETEGTINLVVSRVGGSDGEVTATYQLPDGTTQTLTWANGDDNPRIIKVPLGNDKQLGDNFVVKLTAVSGGATLGIVQHTINITDEPTVGKLQFQQTLVKTTDNSKPVPVMVERVGGSTGTISANYTITFKGVVPVPPVTGVVTWGEGDTTPKSIEVPVNSLSPKEKEFVQVSLDNPVSSYTTPKDPAELLGGIADVAVTVTPPPPSCVEGKTAQIQFAPLSTSKVREDVGEVTFTVTRTGCVESEVAVEYQVMPESTAQLGQDFSLPGTSPLRWPAGDATPKQITLVSNQDEETEGDETVMLQLYNVTGGANLGMDKVTMTIKDGTIGCDKNPTKIQFAPLLLSKVSENVGTLTATVTRTGCTKGEVSVGYQIISGSTATSDFQVWTNTLNWPSGDSQPQTITLTVVDDNRPEPEEEIRLQLAGANVGELRVVSWWVQDDDGSVSPPSGPSGIVQFAQPEYHVTEGEVEYIDIPVTITRPDNSPVGEAEVLCNFNNGQLPTHLIWLAHETVAKNCGRIQIKNDKVITGPREIIFSLSNAGLRTQIGAPATTKLIIAEDDEPEPCTPHFTANEVTVSEADKEVQLTVKCTGGSEGNQVTVDYQTEDKTALAGEDYQSSQGTLTFKQDKTSNLVKIPLIDDDRKEEDKQLVVKLSSPADNGQVTITIQDDDMALPTLGCIATDNTGKPFDLAPETTRCQGGISVEGGEFLNKTIITRNQEVRINGQMTIDPQHVGKDAELVLFVGYTSPGLARDQEVFLMLDTAAQILPWSSNLTDLVAWQTARTLDKTLTATLYQGLLPPGRLTIFFGYRLTADGMVVQNKLPIEVQIDE